MYVLILVTAYCLPPVLAWEKKCVSLETLSYPNRLRSALHEYLTLSKPILEQSQILSFLCT